MYDDTPVSVDATLLFSKSKPCYAKNNSIGWPNNRTIQSCVLLYFYSGNVVDGHYALAIVFDIALCLFQVV
ncbi:MAG: hypothetical protein C0594_00235 [Marinilabiliales bacterium]|nr:MAG: hypothetical protein C0594_00235 [Marinilabiliales bacterium]